MTANTVLADFAHAPVGDPGRPRADDPTAPVQGLGNAGGFKMMLEDRAGLGSEALRAGRRMICCRREQGPALRRARSRCSTPDRRRCTRTSIARRREKVGLTPTDVFSTLQVYLGSQYVNDFNYLGRTYKVIVQADGRIQAEWRRTSGG